MKVILIISSLGFGGKERQFVEFAKGIDKQPSIDFIIIILSNKIEFQEINDLNAIVYKIPRKSKIFDIRTSKSIFSIAKKFGPQIIHSWDHMSSLAVLPTVILQKIILINYSIQYGRRIQFPEITWFISQLTFLFSYKVISNSEAGLIAHNLKPNKKNHIILNGFDFTNRLINVKKKEDTRSDLNIKTKYVIGMVARFDDSKDYKTFIFAANHILSKRKDITFVCVGDGVNFEKTKALIPFENTDYFIFLGKIPYVESIINIFDIGVLICNTNGHAEGLSHSIMEYMAFEKPVIATDSGGNKEIVNNNITGYIIPPFNSNDIVTKINILLSDPPLRKRMGKEGKKLVENKFSETKIINAFVSIYKKSLLNE